MRRDDQDSATRLRAIEQKIAAACMDARRASSDVRLIAVSKTFSADEIVPVIEAGHRHFGENRVQEAQQKWPALKERHADLKLHLIGPLQSNKSKDAVALFDAIHSIDRVKIAEAIAKEIAQQGRTLELYVQVNTGEEPQKAGIMPREAVSFVDMCRTKLNLAITGLMCIPPVDEEPSVHFAFLRTLAERAGIKRLSMGMSSDFEAAIELGATDVRVGSGIFGSRG